MLSDNEGSCGANEPKDILAKIAATLNCSTAAFSEDASFELGDTVKLLELWLKIEHEQDRKKVLSFVRMIADQTAGRQGS